MRFTIYQPINVYLNVDKNINIASDRISFHRIQRYHYESVISEISGKRENDDKIKENERSWFDGKIQKPVAFRASKKGDVTKKHSKYRYQNKCIQTLSLLIII